MYAFKLPSSYAIQLYPLKTRKLPEKNIINLNFKMYIFIKSKEIKSVKISESVTPKYFLYIFTQVGGGSVRSRGTATTS